MVGSAISQLRSIGRDKIENLVRLGYAPPKILTHIEMYEEFERMPGKYKEHKYEILASKFGYSSPDWVKKIILRLGR